MPKFESKPTVADGITPVDPNDLITKKHLDDVFGSSVAFFARHGVNPDYPRPSVSGVVVWEGWVEPNNMAAGDFWYQREPEFAPIITSGAIATGGEESVINISGVDYVMHYFSSSSDFIVTTAGDVEYLIVAGGGGGGGGYYSGGGGAGGLIYGSISVPVGNYPIVVGQGGTGGYTNGGATSGDDSSFYSMVAIGGGRGGEGSGGLGDGADGGSGGGGAGQSNFGGSGTEGQGFGGGTAISYSGGGGGGYISAGGNGNTTPTSNGGEAFSSLITGEQKFYAAGGGGNPFTSAVGYTDKKNGIGGAGRGGLSIPTDFYLSDGVDGTGSGGGGSDRRRSGYTRAGNGGDGVVIIRYPI